MQYKYISTILIVTIRQIPIGHKAIVSSKISDQRHANTIKLLSRVNYANTANTIMGQLCQHYHTMIMGQHNHSAHIVEQMIQSLSQDHAKDIHKMTERREPNE